MATNHLRDMLRELIRKRHHLGLLNWQVCFNILRYLTEFMKMFDAFAKLTGSGHTDLKPSWTGSRISLQCYANTWIPKTLKTLDKRSLTWERHSVGLRHARKLVVDSNLINLSQTPDSHHLDNILGWTLYCPRHLVRFWGGVYGKRTSTTFSRLLVLQRKQASTQQETRSRGIVCDHQDRHLSPLASLNHSPPLSWQMEYNTSAHTAPATIRLHFPPPTPFVFSPWHESLLLQFLSSF